MRPLLGCKDLFPVLRAAVRALAVAGHTTDDVGDETDVGGDVKDAGGIEDAEDTAAIEDEGDVEDDGCIEDGFDDGTTVTRYWVMRVMILPLTRILVTM